MNIDSTDLLAAAVAYAHYGWPVFLLGRNKRPIANCAGCRNSGPDHDPATCECLTCHAFHAATIDPDRIAAMCAMHPQGLLAIRTGTASGLVVVDIDPRNGGALDPDLMSPTATVATGGGWHLYYRHPGGHAPSRGLPDRSGVDIKADGGYVVAPPSIHPATQRPYRWVSGRPVNEMPPPLLRLCLIESATTDSAAYPPTTLRTTAGGRGISSPQALLTAHLEVIARAPQGKRRTTLYGAARGVARMVTAGALTTLDALTALTEAGRAAGQTDRDIRAAITGGFHAEGVQL